MSLEKILSISGKPGLYKLTQQTRSGFLAESLIDSKKISVNARHNVSLLSEIAIYTLTEEVPLRDVFTKIAAKADHKETISHKVPKIELEEFFFEILPDYDEERVYPSDIKKIVHWYNLLVKNDITDFSQTDEAPVDTPQPK
jgi:argininosuccinate lyase